MTGFSIGVRNVHPHAGRARRIRTVVGGRQTRADIVVSATLLTLSLVATVANFVLAVQSFPSFRECAALACGYGGNLDVYAITFLASMLVGTNFAARAVLNLLNRRNAWGYSLLDAIVSFVCLFGGLAWVSAF